VIKSRGHEIYLIKRRGELYAITRERLAEELTESLRQKALRGEIEIPLDKIVREFGGELSVAVIKDIISELIREGKLEGEITHGAWRAKLDATCELHLVSGDETVVGRTVKLRVDTDVFRETKVRRWKIDYDRGKLELIRSPDIGNVLMAGKFRGTLEFRAVGHGLAKIGPLVIRTPQMEISSNKVEVHIRPLQPEIKLLLDGPKEVPIGSTGSLYVYVSNNGQGSASGVEIRIELPEGLRALSPETIKIGAIRPGTLETAHVDFQALRSGHKKLSVTCRYKDEEGTLLPTIHETWALEVMKVSPKLVVSFKAPKEAGIGRDFELTATIACGGSVARDISIEAIYDKAVEFVEGQLLVKVDKLDPGSKIDMRYVLRCGKPGRVKLGSLRVSYLDIEGESYERTWDMPTVLFTEELTREEEATPGPLRKPPELMPVVTSVKVKRPPLGVLPPELADIESFLDDNGIPHTYTYSPHDVIGDTPHSVVVRARDEDGRLVALKIMRPMKHTGEPSKLEKEFLKNARIAKKLHHPHIVSVYECGPKPLAWMCMKLMEGGSLRDRLAEGPLPVREALDIAIKIAYALHYLHHKGLIHRDIKPENILFDENGVPKISDLGSLKYVLDMTYYSGFRGTYEYAPPELFPSLRREFGEPDHRSDIYSLGAVLYEMLTSRPPFEGEDPKELVEKIARKEPEPPSKLNPDVPKELDSVVLKALKKRKEDRYEAVIQFKDRLKEVLKTLG